MLAHPRAPAPISWAGPQVRPRGFGKPVQTISTEVDEAEQRRLELANIPTPELERQLAEMRARIGRDELPETTG